MKAYRALLVCGAIFSFSAAKITASTVIDNTVSWPGWDVGTWGEPLQTATVGQTFTVGADTRLDSFTFFLAHDSSYDPLTFAAYLMLWNPTGNRATGPVLFQSGTLHSNDLGYPPTHPGYSVQPFTVLTGGVQLATGQQYVAFFSTSLVNEGNGKGWLGYAGDTYSGGQFAYIANGTNFSALTTSTWTTGYPDTGGDLAFRMAFNTVPEPRSVLSGALLGGLVLIRHRRQKYVFTV